MSDYVRIGANVGGYTVGKQAPAYTQVVIHVSDDVTYTAGTSSGAVLEFDNPAGTQAMADTILTQISGYAYQPYSATDALINPLAEIGDAVLVASTYSILADINYDFGNLLLTADISAPESGEMLSEYPYLPPIQRAVEAAQSTADDAYSIAETAASTAADVDSVIEAWSYNGDKVQIDGANIRADTVTASKLRGGTVQLLTSSENVAGAMSITGASSADYAIEMSSGGALRFDADDVVFLEDGSNDYLYLNGSEVVVKPDLRPSSDGNYNCGTSDYRWNDVWATNGQIQTSDANYKTDINGDLSAYDEFVKRLRPVSYKFVDGHRTHIGFIAQEVEQALADCDIDTENFAGLIKSPNKNGGYNYALRYTEFIALQQRQIQMLEARIKALEDRMNG